VLFEKCSYEAGTRLFLGPGTQRRLMFPVTLADILELNKDTTLAGLSNTKNSPQVPKPSIQHSFYSVVLALTEFHFILVLLEL